MMPATTASQSKPQNSGLKQERNAYDFLSYQQIEDEYPGTIKAGTAAVWACAKRYGFHLLITRIGNKPRVRRDRWEAFLDSRTPCTEGGSKWKA